MIYWILLIASVVILGWIFFRRYRLTLKSLGFEEELKKEMAEEEKSEDPDQFEEALDEATDLQKKRQQEQKDRQEHTERIRKAKRAFKQADIHFTKGDYGLAEKFLLQVLSFDNDHLDANSKLGLLYLHQENLPRAEFFFQKLIDLKESPVYLSNLALVLYQQKRLAEAAKLYERAIELDSKRAARFVSLAHVYHELGEMEKALSRFEEAARLEPRNLDYWWVLVDYYEKFSKVDAIVQALKRILELDPYNEEAQGKLALILDDMDEEVVPPSEELPEQKEPIEEKPKKSSNPKKNPSTEQPEMDL